MNKYEEALALARQGKSVDEIFPELRESEDERIRKEIIKFIQDFCNPCDPEGDKWIAYLEKQKEQDECPEYCVRSHCMGCSIYEKKKEQKPNIELIQRSWYMEGYTDGEFKREPMWNLVTGKGGPRYEKNEKYGQPLEQKPAEWSEEDEQMLSYIICAIRNHYTVDQIKDKLINWLRTRPFQISAQWDVEQQWCFEDVIALLIADGHEREANVLKALFNQSKIGLSKKKK